MYCLHKSGEVCTQFQLYILLHLVQSTSVTVQRGNLMKSQLYTYLCSESYACNSRKTTMHFGSLVWTQTSERMLDTAFSLHWLQSSTRSVHNSRKNHLVLYTYKNYETHRPQSVLITSTAPPFPIGLRPTQSSSNLVIDGTALAPSRICTQF